MVKVSGLQFMGCWFSMARNKQLEIFTGSALAT